MSWIYDLSWKLIGQLADFSLRSLGVLLVALLVLALFRPRNASARHAVWTMVLAAMLALPVLSLVLPPVPLKIARPVMRMPADITVNSKPVTASKSRGVLAAGRATEPGRPQWPIVAAAVYCALTLGFLLRFLVGYRFSRR